MMTVDLFCQSKPSANPLRRLLAWFGGFFNSPNTKRTLALRKAAANLALLLEPLGDTATLMIEIQKGRARYFVQSARDRNDDPRRYIGIHDTKSDQLLHGMIAALRSARRDYLSRLPILTRLWVLVSRAIDIPLDRSGINDYGGLQTLSRAILARGGGCITVDIGCDGRLANYRIVTDDSRGSAKGHGDLVDRSLIAAYNVDATTMIHKNLVAALYLPVFDDLAKREDERRAVHGNITPSPKSQKAR